MPYVLGFPCLLCVCRLPEARMFGPQGDKINCRVLEIRCTVLATGRGYPI